MVDNAQSLQQFNAYETQRMNRKFPPKLDAMLDYCENILHFELNKKNIKSKPKNNKKHHELPEEYRRAVKSLTLQEKLGYYINLMRMIIANLDKKTEQPSTSKGMFSSDGYSRSYKFNIWKPKRIRLDKEKKILFAEKDNRLKTFILDNYLLRKSKNKQYHCFVLEAINSQPQGKLKTAHLGFKDEKKFNEWYKQLQDVFKAINYNYITNAIQQMKIKGLMEYVETIKSQRNKNEIEQQQILTKSQVIEHNSFPISFLEDIQDNSIRDSCNYTESVDRSTYNNNQFLSNDSSDENENNKSKPIQTLTQAIMKTKIVDFNIIQQKQNQKQQQMIIANQEKQDIFHRLMPAYKLANLTKTTNYGLLYEEGKLKIMGHLEQPSKIKMFLSMPTSFSSKLILNGLTHTDTIKKAIQQIEQLSLKTLIKSQNSAMIYMKMKSYNRLYRPRDFIFLRHAFRTHNNTYIIDKSIHNLSFPPFTTIVRGELCILWGIIKQAEQCTLVADLTINNQGYLNDAQNVNLVLKFLKPFTCFENTIITESLVLQNFNILNDNWNIIEQFVYQTESHQFNKQKNNKQIYEVLSNSMEINQIFQKRKQNSKSTYTQNNLQLKTNNLLEEFKQMKLDNQTSSKYEQKQTKYANMRQRYSHMQLQRGQIDENEAQDQQKLKHDLLQRNFDQQGYVIVSNNFMKTKYILEPLPKKQTIFQEAIKGHPIWKGEWLHDDKIGAIIFINKKKINDQKGVLKFIVTQIGKNLLSGKSVMNISLPVDIFSSQSNLERLIYSLTYAPIYLQPAANDKNLLQRLKKVISFGVSNSPLYLNMEKPFNPILGETFQCWIDGCPAYAEQISHHPPIAALLYKGRGFTITAQLQSKMQVHMNSGCGVNDGIFKIKFDDNVQICYITPGGEVSGLVYGDRKFNIVAYYWIEQQNIFLQLVFNPTKKGFFSVRKQTQPIDYFQGTICKVKQQFMESFIKKKRSPHDNQITEKIAKVSGIWNKYVKYENEVILDLQKQFPVQLQYEANPLPSDSNWRQDIAYRRILQISRAQTEKERLQKQQRYDKKLRENKINHSHTHKK